jgi:hypothetical protein
MTTLDERLRAAADAMGDPPHAAPPFASLQRRRRRRHRATAVVAAVLSIALVCAVALVATARDPVHPLPAGTSSTPTSAAVSTTRPVSHTQSLASMPRLPASVVHTVSLSRSVELGSTVLAGGSFWSVGTEPGCRDLRTCPWLFRIDPSTGAVVTVGAPALGVPGAGPLAVGDGAAFVTTFDYRGLPASLLAVDLATGRRRFSVPIPGTSVQGNPKFRISFGAGAVWISEGAMPITEFDARTGSVVARIRLPQKSGAEAACCPGTAFDSAGLWLVGGDSGTAVMHVDPLKHRAAVVLDAGPGFTQSLAADGRYVWTTHFAENPARLDLTRIDLDAADTPVAAGIPTSQVAAGGGQVWFAGYAPGDGVADPRNHYGVVGRVDPVTMKVVGVTELPGFDAITNPSLFVDSRGAWVLGPSSITHIVAD